MWRRKKKAKRFHKRRTYQKSSDNRITKEVIGLFLAAAFSFFAVAIFSYNQHDNTLFNYASNRAEVSNWAGVVGAQVAATLLYLLGSTVYLMLICFMVPAYLLLITGSDKEYKIRFGFLPVLVIVGAALCNGYGFDITRSYPGGLIGDVMCNALAIPFGVGGTAIILWTLFLASVMMILKLSIISVSVLLSSYACQGLKFIVQHLVIVSKTIVNSSWFAVKLTFRWVISLVVHVVKRKESKDAQLQPVLSLEISPAFELSPEPMVQSRSDLAFWDSMVEVDVTKKPGRVVVQPPPSNAVQTMFEDDETTKLIERFAHKEIRTLALMKTQRRQTINPTGQPEHQHLILKNNHSFSMSLPNLVVGKNMFSFHDGEHCFVLQIRQALKACEQQKRLSKSSFVLPDLSLFIQKKNTDQKQKLKDEAIERGKKLEEKLEHFGVNGKIVAIKPGPLITLFEYQLEIDSKISKITSLEDDLAMALSATSIRIIAPIPGKNAIGFEIANPSRENVLFSEVVATKDFQESSRNLPMMLGVDVVGSPIVEDLVKMPHLLIGGTTGSGKSVGLNAMLASLLCKQTPDHLRIILIDPKRLEFTPYADIPHLLFPIVTNPLKATKVLSWVVQEMEERYEKMARIGVRSISEYQRCVAQGRADQEGNLIEPMPFIVVMIDELADLMIVAGKEVETHIVRIAQMARASGIHMIVATQRPSVDVVTGLIKVNFPSRIAFRVSSKVDSRTILDERGAEILLGRGDMLFKNSASSHLSRIHGAFISDQEIQSLSHHLKTQQAVEYLDLREALETVGQKQKAEMQDELYPHVVDYLKGVDEISISMLQRQYRIGFNRSARIIEQLEMEGLLAPAQGSKPRKVIH